MKKIFNLLLLLVAFNVSAQFEHATKVELKDVEELPVALIDTRVLITDPVTGEIKYIPLSTIKALGAGPDLSNYVTKTLPETLTGKKTWNVDDLQAIQVVKTGLNSGINIDNLGDGVGLTTENRLEGNGIFQWNYGSGANQKVISKFNSTGDAYVLLKEFVGGVDTQVFKIDNVGNTLMQELEIEQAIENTLSDEVLVRGADNKVGFVSKASLDTTTASNGLTLNGSDIELGGSLTKNTVIDIGNKSFEISGEAPINLKSTIGIALDAVTYITKDLNVGGKLTAEVINEDLTADRVIVTDASGELKSVPKASLEQDLSDVMFKSVNETITGKKTFEVTGNIFDGINGGIVIENNTTNLGGIYVNNNFSGAGVDVSNFSTGQGISTSNESSGTGLFVANQSTGVGSLIRNYLSGTALIIDNILGSTGDSFIVQKGFAGDEGVSTEVFKIDNVGNTTLPILNVNDFINLQPLTTPPTAPTKGTIYFDDTTNKARCYDGTTWKNLF